MRWTRQKASLPARSPPSHRTILAAWQGSISVSIATISDVCQTLLQLDVRKSKVEIAWTKTLTRWIYPSILSLTWKVIISYASVTVSFNCCRSPWLEWTKCQLFSFLLLFVLSRLKWMNECERRRGNRPTSCRTNNTYGRCSFQHLSFSLWSLPWTGGRCFSPFSLFQCQHEKKSKDLSLSLRTKHTDE